jgi:hypothetical protein
VSGWETNGWRGTVEGDLARLWTRILGTVPASVEADFFALGGDSLATLRLAELARDEGLVMNPSDVLAHPTLGELARVVTRTPAGQAGPDAPVGGTPLLPSQSHWLSGKNPGNHNFSLFAKVGPELEAGVMAAAARAVVAHHDALRERFISDGDSWTAVVEDEVAEGPFESLDLREVPPDDVPEAVGRAVRRAHRSIDLSRGPLLRVLHLRLRPPEEGRLLVVCHHVAVDQISWPRVVGDLLTAYQQLSRGSAVSLPPVRTSLSAWAHRLAEHARSEDVRREADRWLSPPFTQAAPLPADYAKSGFAESEELTTSVALPKEATEALLARCARGRGGVLAMLMAVLARANHLLTGSPVFGFTLTRHGRESIFPDLDVTRTVGWLAHWIPWTVDVREAGTAQALAANIHRELLALPSGGLGYSLLRHLSPDLAVRRALESVPWPETSIRYIGVMPGSMHSWLGEAGSLLKGTAPEPPRVEAVQPNFDTPGLLYEAGIFGGQLTLRFYLYRIDKEGRAVRRPVRALVEAVVGELRGLLLEA